MAMGNFCYIQSIECPYATVLGTCRDDIYSDFNKCEMNGDDMPPIEWPPHERRSWCVNQHAQMLDLIQGTVQAAVAECKDKTKQFAQTEVEKYLKGAVVMNAIHEEIKRVVPQAVLDALRGV